MRIQVKVFPNSKKDQVIKTGERNFEVKVKTKPVRGKANTAVAHSFSLLF